MRSEEEIYSVILKFAEADDRILGVYQNGSRINRNAPKDIFQDYDLVLVVKETKPWIDDQSWLTTFGEIMYFQLPDETPGEITNYTETYGWLIQFCDGVRQICMWNRLNMHKKKCWKIP